MFYFLSSVSKLPEPFQPSTQKTAELWKQKSYPVGKGAPALIFFLIADYY